MMKQRYPGERMVSLRTAGGRFRSQAKPATPPRILRAANAKRRRVQRLLFKASITL
jgi:hypothetical protein